MIKYDLHATSIEFVRLNGDKPLLRFVLVTQLHANEAPQSAAHTFLAWQRPDLPHNAHKRLGSRWTYQHATVITEA